MTKKSDQPLGDPEDKTLPPTFTLKTFIYPYGQKRKVSITFDGVGKTKQSFKAECDINTIMARYMKTGTLDHLSSRKGQYMDVSGADFYAAQNMVANARSMFFGLPSAIRERFENDPGEFLEFMENPANAEEAVKLGLREAQAASSTPPSEAVSSVQPAASTQATAASGGQGDKEPKGSKP